MASNSGVTLMLVVAAFVAATTVMYKSFIRPGSSLKWLKAIPKEDLDKPLSSNELGIIAQHVLEWPDKARGLGLDETDIEDIREDHRANRLQKAAMMRRWREIYGDKATLRELIVISQRNHWSSFIAKVCKDLGYETKELKNSLQKKKIIFTAFNLILVVVLVSGLAFVLSNKNSNLPQNLPHRIPNFVGRESESNELLFYLLNYTASAPRIVTITGPPGFGKSSLAIHVGRKLTDQVNVIYVDLNEASNKDEMIAKLLNTAHNSASTKHFTTRDLYIWSSSLTQQTLVLFDNCDEMYHTDEDFQSAYISGLVKHSNFKFLKVFTTSRSQVMYIEKQHTLVLTELPLSYSCKLLTNIVSSLSSSVCSEVAKLTGGAPLALKVVGALLNTPAFSQQTIMHQLKENLISTLSPEELSAEDRINASIYLSYKYLQSDVRRVGRLLSYFTGSFDGAAGVQVAHYSSTKELKTLVKMSLLDYNRETNRYIFHRLIKEFFKGVSSHDEETEFVFHYLEYYSSVLEGMIEKELSEAVTAFYTDKHNFRHFFDLLSSRKLTNASKKLGEKATAIIREVTETISTFVSTEVNFFQECGFSMTELYSYIDNYLTILKQINRLLIETHGKDWFVKAYSGLILDLIRVEKSFNSDIHLLIEHMESYCWIFSNYHNHVLTHKYLAFYSTLAKYYEDVGNYKKAKSCHEKILKREKLLEECHDNCSSLELAKAFFFKGDCNRSAIYCFKSLNYLLKVDIFTLSFDQSMGVTNQLLDLEYVLASCQLGDSHIVTNISLVLEEISINRILEERYPPSIVAHGKIILDLIAYFENFNLELSESLKFHFYDLAGKYKSKDNALFNLTKRLFNDHKYKTAILVGERFLNLGNFSRLEQYDEIKVTLYIVASSFFHSNKYQESILYFEDVANMNPDQSSYLKFSSCAYLLWAGSFKCHSQIHAILWDVLLSLHIGMINSIGNSAVTTISSSQPISYYETNDFLYTKLEAPFEFKNELIETRMAIEEPNILGSEISRICNYLYSFTSIKFFSWFLILCLKLSRYYINFLTPAVVFAYYCYCKTDDVAKCIISAIKNSLCYILFVPLQILISLEFLHLYEVFVLFAQIDMYKEAMIIETNHVYSMIHSFFVTFAIIVWLLDHFYLHEIIDLALFLYFLSFFCLIVPNIMYVLSLCCLIVFKSIIRLYV